MQKCSLCRKEFELPLYKCWVLKENYHGFGANPNFLMVRGFKTLVLCYICKILSTKLLSGPFTKGRRLKHYPVPLMICEEEERLEKMWKETLSGLD